MKKNTIFYWVATGLTAFAIGFGGVMDLLKPPDMVATMAHLGYPAYLMTLLGIWKVLGAGAILAPGLPRVKEWAYAGIAFDLTGAAFSHAASGDGAGPTITPLVVLAIAAASWYLRPEDRKLPARVTGNSIPAPAYGELARAGNSPS